MKEDIKILEKFKKTGYHTLMMEYGSRNKTNWILERALENLIKGYRELKERNIYLVNERKKLEELLFMSNENYIEKSKIREIIKNWKNQSNYYGSNIIQDLQELLEEEV